jgi:hypothetical protein
LNALMGCEDGESVSGEEDDGGNNLASNKRGYGTSRGRVKARVLLESLEGGRLRQQISKV